MDLQTTSDNNIVCSGSSGWPTECISPICHFVISPWKTFKKVWKLTYADSPPPGLEISIHFLFLTLYGSLRTQLLKLQPCHHILPIRLWWYLVNITNSRHNFKLLLPAVSKEIRENNKTLKEGSSPILRNVDTLPEEVIIQ